MSNWICCTNAGIFPIEIYLSFKKQKKTYFLGIKPGQLVELYEIQNRQLIFSFMSNPTNFGINGSNCVVAFLGVWIVSSGGFLWEDFGRQPSVVVWGSEAALEGIEERGAGFEAALCCLADEIFFVNDGEQGSSLSSFVSSKSARFSGQVGVAASYDVILCWEWELGELFSSAAFHQKKNRRGQAVGEPPGTKTITKTKRREIWMTHYEYLFEYT